MWFPIKATITREDYFEWFPEFTSKKIQNFFKSIDDEERVNCLIIKLSGRCENTYTELWLIDINDETGYAPVFIPNINGSSAHSLWICNFDYDGDEDGDDVILDLDDLLELVCNSAKKSFKEIMEMKYINKPEPVSYEELAKCFTEVFGKK